MTNDPLRPISADPTLGQRSFESSRQTTRYLETGPADGPLMIFLHGWPSIALMWRAQMNTFAAEGWHCVAPDLRGFGGSSAPVAPDAYSIEQVVADMAEFHDHLDDQPAIWVSHDWGCVVAAQLSAHEPKRSRGVVLTSLAYQPKGHALATIVPLVDRNIYPADEYPDGQWDYYRYYNRHFDAAVADLDADKVASLASIFRPGDPAGVGKIASLAVVTRNGGRFGAAHRAPATDPDPRLWPPEDFDELVRTFEAQGFRPSCAWYLNDDAAISYARKAPNGGRLSQPVLFVNGEYDQVCTVIGNNQGDPMRAACSDLTEISMPAGHWLPLELKTELIEAIRTWLQSKKL
jgi:pimeloyl-ACP methyl ester carboxylesterase